MAPIERIDLSAIRFTPELLGCLPAATARMYRVLPVFDRADSLGIVVADASKLEVIDELCFILGRELQVMEADQPQLDEFVDRLYGENEA